MQKACRAQQKSLWYYGANRVPNAIGTQLFFETISEKSCVPSGVPFPIRVSVIFVRCDATLFREAFVWNTEAEFRDRSASVRKCRDT